MKKCQRPNKYEFKKEFNKFKIQPNHDFDRQTSRRVISFLKCDSC